MPKRKVTKRDAERPAWEDILRREVAAGGKILILGIGNPDKADDGAGSLAAEALKKELKGRGHDSRASGACGSAVRKRIKILLGYETPESLTGEIRAFGPRLVIMIDAALGTHAPGAVFIVEREDIPDEGVSTHKISLRILVAYLEKTVGCTVVFLGIQASDLELGKPATPAVERAARDAALALGAMLRSSSA
jgi:hydrogenase maturation protease